MRSVESEKKGRKEGSVHVNDKRRDATTASVCGGSKEWYADSGKRGRTKEGNS